MSLHSLELVSKLRIAGGIVIATSGFSLLTGNFNKKKRGK
jgi:multiple antibiotic resistance protein